jgi:hypothetical protein
LETSQLEIVDLAISNWRIFLTGLVILDTPYYMYVVFAYCIVDAYMLCCICIYAVLHMHTCCIVYA